MIRRVLALARYAAHTNLLTPVTRSGAALLVGVALLGPLISLKNHGTWAFDPDLLGTGFAFGALFVIRSGLVEQRMGGVQDFLRVNLVRAVEHVAGAALSLIAAWLSYTALAWAIAVLLSLGDVATASWTVWLLTLGLAMLLPYTLMVECVTELRTPLVVPGFIYFAALITAVTTLGYQRAASLFALNADPAFPPSSLPLAGRAAALFVGGFLVVLIGTVVRSRCRARRLRAAMDPVGRN